MTSLEDTVWGKPLVKPFPKKSRIKAQIRSLKAECGLYSQRSRDRSQGGSEEKRK